MQLSTSLAAGITVHSYFLAKIIICGFSSVQAVCFMRSKCMFSCGLLADNFAGLIWYRCLIWYRSASFLPTDVKNDILIIENISVVLGRSYLEKLRNGINLCWKMILSWQIFDILADRSNEEWLYGHEVSKRRGKEGKKAQAAEFGSFEGWGRWYLVLTPVGILCLFQNVEKFCSLVSGQDVYLFWSKTSHMLKAILKFNSYD